MRTLGRIFWAILGAVIVVVMAVFAAENLAPVRARFVGSTFSASLWWIVVGSAVLGLVLGMLLVGPGRIAASWRARNAGRERERAQTELVALRERHSALQAERDTLQAERDHLRTRVTQLSRAATPQTSAQPVVSTTTTRSASADGTPGNAAPADTALRATPAPVGATGQDSVVRATPTMGERLRSLLRMPEGDATSETTTITTTDEHREAPPA